MFNVQQTASQKIVSSFFSFPFSIISLFNFGSFVLFSSLQLQMQRGLLFHFEFGRWQHSMYPMSRRLRSIPWRLQLCLMWHELPKLCEPRRILKRASTRWNLLQECVGPFGAQMFQMSTSRVDSCRKFLWKLQADHIHRVKFNKHHKCHLYFVELFAK